MSSRRRLSQNFSASTHKMGLDSINKILKLDSSKVKKQKKAIVRQLSRVALSELVKNTSTAGSVDRSSIIQELPNFKTFLSNEENIQVFREFLKTQYCHENIEFYLACEKYRNLDPERVGAEFIKLMATQIFNDYITKDARQPVNLNHDTVERITADLKRPTPDLLREAQAEIFNLMATDCYPRFCKTWLLDRGTAQKILSESHTTVKSAPHANRTCTSFQTDSFQTSLSSATTRSANTRTNSSVTAGSTATKNKPLPPTPKAVECPSHCPYYSVGLPCQHHPETEIVTSRPIKRDLIDTLDLRRIHKVPEFKVRRSPPPPPLPPKPAKMLRPREASRKSGVFVGKVFHV